MAARNTPLIAVLLTGLFAMCLPAAAPPRKADNEQALLGRLAREHNPVNKAKYEIRLARVKLLQATDTFEKGDVEGTQKLLEAYLGRLKDAWNTLQASGRAAHKNSQGFMQLDIELREDERFLEDLKRRFPFTDREPVERIAREAEQLRNDVLKALFPPEPQKNH